MRIFVTGARGAVGRVLVDALIDAGHEVVAGTRRPETYTGPGTVVPFDLDRRGRSAASPAVDPPGVTQALASCDAAFYLVHALDRRDCEAVDRRRAERFADLWGP